MKYVTLFFSMLLFSTSAISATDASENKKRINQNFI